MPEVLRADYSDLRIDYELMADWQPLHTILRGGKRSTGAFMVLDLIRLAAELGLPYVYLGYWVRGSEKMGYKSDFRPLQVFDGETWRPLRDDEI